MNNSASAFRVVWYALPNEAAAPNPELPDGAHIVVREAAEGARSCRVEVPYPARGVGMYALECVVCGRAACVTATGQADDPRSVTLDCAPPRVENDANGRS